MENTNLIRKIIECTLFIFVANFFCGCINVSIFDVFDKTFSNASKEEQESILAVSEKKYVYSTLTEDEKLIYNQIYYTLIMHEEETVLSTVETALVEKLYNCVLADNGGIFWVNGYTNKQYSLDDKVLKLSFKPSYIMTYEERKQYEKALTEIVNPIIAEANTYVTDYEKAKFIYEYICSNVEYNPLVEHRQNILSTFLSKECVCRGYAASIQFLFTKLGIQSAIITGVARDEAHAWNLIKLDDAYYYMDATWGNSSLLDENSVMGKYVNFNYFTMTTDDLYLNYIPDKLFDLPFSSGIEHNFFARENCYYTEWMPEVIGGKIAVTYNDGGGVIIIKTDSYDLYDRYLDYFIKEQHVVDYCPNITSIYYIDNEKQHVLAIRI